MHEGKNLYSYEHGRRLNFSTRASIVALIDLALVVLEFDTSTGGDTNMSGIALLWTIHAIVCSGFRVDVF